MSVEIYCDATNGTQIDDLPLGNPLAYFVPSLESVLVQKEFAKPIQHGKCPNRTFKDEHLNSNYKKPSKDTHPCRVSGVGFTTLFKLTNSIVIS